VFYCSGNSIINLKTYFSFKPKKLRFQNENAYSGNTPRSAGWIRKKPRVSLERKPAKGYQPSWAVDLKSDGGEMMGGRERRRGHRRNSRRGGPPWQATRSSPERSVRALRSTVRRTEGTGVTRGRRRLGEVQIPAGEDPMRRSPWPMAEGTRRWSRLWP
jgi:hypothetical protein